MQGSRISRLFVASGIQALALAVAIIAGIAVGRWFFPDSDTASSASLEAAGSASTPAFESARSDAPAEGHVIGIRFQEVVPLVEDSASMDSTVAPDSPAEGHVIGVRFR